eukprot:SAG11_NODE_34579_length_271_cov_0.604651_1_plen_56_part_01
MSSHIRRRLPACTSDGLLAARKNTERQRQDKIGYRQSSMAARGVSSLLGYIPLTSA